MNTKLFAALGVLAVGAPLAPAQTFDAASVKVSTPQSVRGSQGGPGTRDPGQYTFNVARLSDLLFLAYGLVDHQQISGPAWLDSEHYDVAVKIPAGTTKPQFQQMLQALLAERFRLVAHHETKQFAVYELTVGKMGSKLKESEAGSSAPPAFTQKFGPGPHSNWNATQQPLSNLAGALSSPNATGARVIDKTGLSGLYDFKLEYDMEPAPETSVFDAVQEQLGLKLTPGKAAFDMIVVDHAEKVPVEN